MSQLVIIVYYNFGQIMMHVRYQETVPSNEYCGMLRVINSHCFVMNYNAIKRNNPLSFWKSNSV